MHYSPTSPRSLFSSAFCLGLSLATLSGNWVFGNPTDTEISSAPKKKAKHAVTTLIAESLELKPGVALSAGLHMTLEPGWHVYWKNPGDAGLPVRLTWTMPPGFSVDSLQWPTPERIAVEPMMNYGYSEEVVLPFAIHAPKSQGQGQITLKAKAKWLVCKDICLPEEADLSLTLAWPGAMGSLLPTPHSKSLITRFQAELPLAQSDWQASASRVGDHVLLSLNSPAGLKTPDSLWFFPSQGDWMEHAAPESLSRSGGALTLKLKLFDPTAALPERLQGVVAARNSIAVGKPQTSFEIDIPLLDTQAILPALSTLETTTPPDASELDPKAGVTLPVSSAPVSGSAWELLLKLVLAFAGGLILNLMPCVLPVLSLKIFDFVQRAGHARLKVFMHGLTFTAGVLVSFWLLAGLLLILRQGGEQLGWGYQLQSPPFLVVLCALFFFFSLNLFGVFEMGYLFTRLGQRSEKGPGGHLASFMAGVTATVVATPCTAPFMGSAMGFAFTQSAAVALAIFTFVGLGMASPYLLLSGFPGLMRVLPKPGEWMEHLKQFMGFPLLATAIWLAWILGRQAGLDALIALLAVLLLGGLSAWILGKWAALHHEISTRIIAVSVALAIFIPAFVLVLLFIHNMPAHSQNGSPINKAGVGLHEIPWQPFRQTLLDSLVAQGQPVLLDFTADWCLSCKVNEKIALQDPKVVAKLRELGVAALRGDWTRSDGAITAALAGYGRQSVPVYVLYSGKSASDYRLLPEILSANIVLEALSQLPKPESRSESALPVDSLPPAAATGTI